MTKKELFFKIKQKLDILYPEVHCTLDYTTPFELLIATMLAAQCTDARVNIVTKEMFKKYNTPEAFAKLSLKEIENDHFIQRSTHGFKRQYIYCRLVEILVSCGSSLNTREDLPADLMQMHSSDFFLWISERLTSLMRSISISET